MATEMMVPVDTSMPDIEETVPDDIVIPGVQHERIVVQGPDEVIETEPLTSTVDASIVVQDLDNFDHTTSSAGNSSLVDGVMTTTVVHSRLPDDDLEDDEEISNDEEDDIFMSSSDDEVQDVIVDDGGQVDDDDYIVDEDDVYDDDDYIEEDESAPYKPRKKGHGRRISSSLKRKPQGMYKCSECYKAFALFENLQKHSRLHTAESPFACQICRKPFTKPSALERHMRTHTGERPYNCDNCGKGFTRRSHLQRHVKLHYSSQPYRCSECRSAFTTEEALYEHKTIHVSQAPTDIQQSQRGGQSAPSMEFLAQAALLAGAELLNGQPAEGSRSQLAYNARQMEVLMNQQTREQAAEASGGIMLAEGKYKCRKCAKTFAKLGSLEKHAILHTNQSPFKCQYCHRGFPKPSILKRHTGVHLREQDIAVRRKPHSYMSATSRRRQARQVEEEEQEEVYGEQMGDGWEGETGKKKFKCEHCWQSFVFEENLDRHQLRHTEASPYKCGTCKRPFTKQSKLLRHEKTHQISSASGQGGGVSGDMGQEELDEVPRDINDDVQAILAASSKGKGRQSKKKGHHRRRSSGLTGSTHKSRRGKKRKVLVPRAEKRAAKKHKGHLAMQEPDMDSLPGHQITPVDANNKSPVGALHITSVDSVEVPLPTAAPPEQLMDSPPPRTEEEVVLDGEEVVDAPVDTDHIDASGEMVVQQDDVVVNAEHIEETPVEDGSEMLVVSTVADDILETIPTGTSAGNHISFSTEFASVSEEDGDTLVVMGPIESDPVGLDIDEDDEG